MPERRSEQMNIIPVKMEISEFLRIAAIVMGILCIVAAVIMMYHGEMILIGNMSVTAGLVFLMAGLVLIIVSLIGGGRQKGQQISIRVWHIFLPVLIVLLIVYVSTRYSLQGDDKYTVLVDLILIMLAVTGMIGYITYRWISRGVSERVALVIKEGQNFAKAQAATTLGFGSFDQYEAEMRQIKEIQNIWKKLSKIQPDQEDYNPEYQPTDVVKTHLEDAITSTTRALNLMKQLDEDKYESFICTCKNNLAYYLAEKKRVEGKIDELESKLSVEYATFIWERIQKYPSHKANWADTYEFVRKQFPSSFS